MTEFYKITATDQVGNEIGVYANEKTRRESAAMLSSEYGNITVTPVSREEIPADLLESLED